MSICICISLFALLLSTAASLDSLVGGDERLSDDQILYVEAVGRCRAQCMDHFAGNMIRITDRICSQSPDCSMCWDNCHKMFQDWNVWGVMCGNPVVCFVGCQVVCDFYHEQPSAAPEGTGWKFLGPLKESRSVQEGSFRVDWHPAHPNNPVRSHIIYAPFWRNRVDGAWSALPHTLAHHYATTNGIMVLQADDFRVLAVSKYGAVAVAKFPRIVHERISIKDASLSGNFESGQLENTFEIGFEFILIAIGVTILVGAVLTGFFVGGYFLQNRWRRQRPLVGRQFAMRRKTSALRRSLKEAQFRSSSQANLLKIDHGLAADSGHMAAVDLIGYLEAAEAPPTRAFDGPYIKDQDQAPLSQVVTIIESSDYSKPSILSLESVKKQPLCGQKSAPV